MEQEEGAQGDDAELTVAVRAAQHGSERAFRTVYRAVQPRLLTYVRALVGETDAEDVASEAWLQIARDLGRFDGDADRFRGWTARIARNRALDHLRTRGRRPAVGGDETALADRPGGADTAAEALESLDTRRAFDLIARLPQDQAEAVVLRVVVGLDAKSVAHVLGKRPGAVRTAAHRGLRRLAELLGDTDPGAAPSRPRSSGGSRASRGAEPAPGASSSGTAGGSREPSGDRPTVSPAGDAARWGTGPSSEHAVPPSEAADRIPGQRTRHPAMRSAGVTDSWAATQRDM